MTFIELTQPATMQHFYLVPKLVDMIFPTLPHGSRLHLTTGQQIECQEDPCVVVQRMQAAFALEPSKG